MYSQAPHDKHIPKVSVVIPVYNAEKHLRECLDSVVNQTLKDLEIICVNDGSTDNSLQILNEYASKDDRFVILTQENQGAGTTKKRGLTNCKGEFITFVDSDDFLDIDLIEILHKIALEEKADVTMTKNLHFYINGSIKYHSFCIDKTILKTPEEKAVIMKQTGMNQGKLFNHSFIKKYGITCHTTRAFPEDNLLTQCAFIMANKVVITDKTSYYYRKHESNITNSKRDEKQFGIFDVYKSIDNYIKQHIKNPLLQRRYQHALNGRKIQDLKWFCNECDDRVYEIFKDKLKEYFPEIYSDIIAPVIISMTSYPARIKTVNQTIESLLNQTLKAEKIILWLAPEQFPNREKDLPQQLLNLVPKGLTIDWYKDIKSYKKLIPALQKYPNTIIATVDDDTIYNKDWLEKLYYSYKKHPKDIQAHRVTKFKYKKGNFIVIPGGYEYYNKASYLNKLTGVGGVLYPPNCFYKDILNEKLMMELAPTNDDQWFWLQAALKGIKVRVVDNPNIKINYIPNTQETALCKINDTGEKLFWVDFCRIISRYPRLKYMLILEYFMRKIADIFAPSKLYSKNIVNNHKVYKICGVKFKFKNKKYLQKPQMESVEAK